MVGHRVSDILTMPQSVSCVTLGNLEAGVITQFLVMYVIKITLILLRGVNMPWFQQAFGGASCCPLLATPHEDPVDSL